MLAKPPRLTSVKKKRTVNYLAQPVIKVANCRQNRKHQDFTDEQLSKAIAEKVEDCSIRSAVRILLSDDKPAKNNDITFN